MTNKRLGELMGVHPNNISYLKNQDIMPRVGAKTLDALCWYLDCTPTDLIDYVRDRPPQQADSEAEDDEP